MCQAKLLEMEKEKRPETTGETDQCRDSIIVKHRECYEVGSRAVKGCQRRVSPSSFVEGPGRASWKK